MRFVYNDIGRSNGQKIFYARNYNKDVTQFKVENVVFGFFAVL